MPQQMLYLDQKLLDSIKQDIKSRGYGIKISGWISQACKEKIEGDNCKVKPIIDKLKQWNRSFPRKKFSELILEIETDYYEKI